MFNHRLLKPYAQANGISISNLDCDFYYCGSLCLIYGKYRANDCGLYAFAYYYSSTSSI